MIYDRHIIALVKGIYACGVSAKIISNETGIPYSCVTAWCYNRRALNVREDLEPKQALAVLYQKVVYAIAENKAVKSLAVGEALPNETASPA